MRCQTTGLSKNHFLVLESIDCFISQNDSNNDVLEMKSRMSGKSEAQKGKNFGQNSWK